MKKVLLFYVFGLALCLTKLSAVQEYQAFVIRPVVDLMGQPLSHSPKKGLSLEQYYYQLPFSGSLGVCFRLHQLLFNEVVTVIEERGAEAKVKISNFYYLKDKDNIPQDAFWMLKKDLCPLDKSKKKNNGLTKIPPSISYKEKKFHNTKDERVITLKKPFFDSETQKTYSVGTRFIACPNQDFSGAFDRGCFSCYIYDAEKARHTTTDVPKNLCIRNYSSLPKDKIQNFVQVLRSWTYQKNGFIPYVLGGFSWTHNCESNDYFMSKDSHTNNVSYSRKEWQEPLKQGFDCVGIIGRAAQICEIPLFCKNTTTLIKELKHLSSGQKISEGDLIWYPGHVVIATNSKKNMILEARGYENGRGKVQETPIEQVFEGIKTYDQLVDHYINKKPITVLNSEGGVYKKHKTFKILKINSLWK